MSNPYSNLKDYQFWRRSVSAIESHLFDPVVKPRYLIAADAKVATAGSCFAQHISRRLREINFNYYVPEAGTQFSAEERSRRQFGLFSARFGNIYTTAQLHQLFLEAFGRRTPLETAWERADHRFIDPYRQQVEPDGFASPAAVAEDRAQHLMAVRKMFLETDVFIFTLGLTEAWRNKEDLSVFPLAPGVVASDYDPERHEFVNFGVDDVYGDLSAFLAELKIVNPNIKVLLTVSPVPLIATFEDRSVLSSTTYSKAVLRVVAEMAIKAHDWVEYFPSYEIITGSYAGGLYYEDDHREVNRRGVAHAMRCFLKNFVERDEEAERAHRPAATFVQDYKTSSNIICDEEMLEAVRGSN